MGKQKQSKKDEAHQSAQAAAAADEGADPEPGGKIKRITERVSPRTFRVVALAAPTDREKSQMYIQRYIEHFPAAGEVVIFDRSWYNRAGVEPVMGFCTPEQTERFLDQVPGVEKAMVESGIHLIKYWLEVSADEQTRRLTSRIDDPRKIWKLSELDLKSYSRWFDYSRAPRCDARRHRHLVGPVVRRPHRRQETRPIEHHLALALAGALREDRTARGEAPTPPGGWRLRRARPAAPADPRALLTTAEVTTRLATYGKNEVATEPPPTTWQMAKAQIANLAGLPPQITASLPDETDWITPAQSP